MALLHEYVLSYASANCMLAHMLLHRGICTFGALFQRGICTLGASLAVIKVHIPHVTNINQFIIVKILKIDVSACMHVLYDMN